MKYTADEGLANLSSKSLEVGMLIIKVYSEKYSKQLLKILETFLNRSAGVSNIIFLGALAPYL